MRSKYLQVLKDDIARRGLRRALGKASKFVGVLAGANLGRALTGPISGVILLTYRCNHRCRMCNFPERAVPDEEMSTEKIGKLIDGFAEIGTTGISFYGGEPLLRPDLPELIAHARRRGMLTHLTTNGFLLDEARAKSLVGAGIDLVSISLDGADPETNDRQRGVEGAFSAAKRAVKNLIGARAESGARPRVALTTTLTRDNLNQVEAMVELGRTLKADSHTLLEVQPAAGLDNSFAPKDILRLKNALRSIEKLKMRYPKYIDNSEGYLRLARALLEGESVRFKCFAPYTDLFVDPRGRLYPCNWFLWMDQPMGNLEQSSLREIWYSEEMRRIRAGLAMCGRCNHLCHRELSGIFNRFWLGEKPSIDCRF
ncbi:MAG TPA: radical SAM protein [bacterium]|nr:radical SAM protein [bacterium]HPJ71079.1 radical SAM protein [bacterium]HPQ65189.1 radical SAM protein [bacterium]